jgi:hypothetical protein
MGKYTRYPIRSKSKRQMSPIWRGVGCILIVIVPLMSFWLMLLLAPPIIATGLVPYQLLGYIQFPVWVLRNKMTSGIALFIGSFNHPWLSIIIFLVVLLILSAIISLSYTALYQTFGPVRYTPVDAPPSKHKPKKYTR